MKCKVCQTEITDEEVSPYAAFGGLPSPCCVMCIEVNDYRIKSVDELAEKSLLLRAQKLIGKSAKSR